MKIRMLKTTKASIDGFSVKTLVKDEIYEVDQILGHDLCEELKVAEPSFVKVEVDDGDDQPPKSIQDLKPSEWVGLKLKEKDSGVERVVASTSGNQVFFDGDDDNPIDYRTVRNTMENVECEAE